MLPVRLVIDTNVVVSAALNAEGLQRTTFLLAITKPARWYLSNQFLKSTLKYFPVPNCASEEGFACNCSNSSRIGAI